MSDAVEMRDPFNTATAMLVRSLQQREALAEDLQEKVPAVIEALVDCCLGLWKEKDVLNKKGEVVGTKIYQMSPDAKAIGTLLRLSGMEPEELSKVLLDMNRVRALEADVEADLAKAKALNLKSQTLLNEENAKAFSASFVLEEDVQSAALSVASACIGFIQNTPVEVMQENCKDSTSYQAWQRKAAKIIWDAYGEKVGGSDNPAIESGEEEENEDGEEEDEE
jgi:hypothetical protein